jgi:hypothetical protein
MKKSSFWSDASRCGAVVGAVNVLTTLIGMLMPSIAFVTGLVNFVATVYLLFYFTRKRANLYIEEGFTYSQSLGFIVASALFVGVVCAVYQILASNFIFTEKIEQQLSTTIAELQKTGVYQGDMIKQMASMMRSYMFNPISILWSQILGNVLYLGFLGLFISVGTKREPVLFEIQEVEEPSDESEE